MKVPAARRQRIALARVILKDTLNPRPRRSGIGADSPVGAGNRQTLTGMMEGKTVNALARSPSTFALTCRIVVSDQGFVVRIASHAAAPVQGGSCGGRWSACFASSPLPAVEAPR